MSNEPETEKSQSEDVELPEVKRRRRARSKWLPRQVFAAVAGFLSLLGLAYLLTLLVKRKIDGSKALIVATTSATSTILGGKKPGQNRSAERDEGVVVNDAKTPVTNLANVAKFEVATLKEPAGAAYNSEVTNLPISEKAIPLDCKEALEVRSQLELYLKAKGWKEKLSYVFEPERVETSLSEYYDQHQEEEPVPGKLMGASQIMSGGSTVVSLYWGCSSRVVPGLRAHFHRTRAGQWLLDWEAWVAFSQEPWPQIKQKRLTSPILVRAVASEDDYYNYEFAPESWRYLAVKLRSPDGVHSLTGYCLRASGLGVAMANLVGVPLPQKIDAGTPGIAIRPPGTQTSVTVRVAFPPSAQSDHCVWITDLLADRWLLFDGEY